MMMQHSFISCADAQLRILDRPIVTILELLSAPFFFVLVA
jgi:hypothetical protein